MKVLLVYCNSMLENALPVGLSQISACLKEAGIHVDLFDTTFYRFGNKSDTENRIEGLQLSSLSAQFQGKVTCMRSSKRKSKSSAGLNRFFCC